MKCLILAFDGLEYTLVKKFNLQNVMQKECGKVKIPNECYIEVESVHFEEPIREPYTPLVWSSFLTGKLPSEYGFMLRKWDNEILNMLKRLSIKLGLDRVKGKGKILELLGFNRYHTVLQDYKISTIFDLTQKSVKINIPIYSEEEKKRWHENRRQFIRLHADPRLDLPTFIKVALQNVFKEFENIKAKTLQGLKTCCDWELFMTYTRLLDTYGELCFTPEGKLREIYRIVDDFVKDVKSLAGENYFCLIISDHGMERMGNSRFGKHSNYGFYSINHRFGLNVPVITDFHNLINNALHS